MGLIYDNPIQITWLNASEGHLINKKLQIDAQGIAGLITGIRTREESYAGKTTTKIQIRIMDHSVMDPNKQYVITGTLYNHDGSVSVFGRMLLQRLANPANHLDQAEPVVLSIYPGGDSKATCLALRLTTDPTTLPGLDFRHKEDPAYCRQMAEKCLRFVIEKYGSFGKGVEEQIYHNDDEPDGDPFDTGVSQQSRPAAPAAVAGGLQQSNDHSVSPPWNEDAPHPAGAELFERPAQIAANVGPDESAWNGRGLGGDDLPF